MNVFELQHDVRVHRGHCWFHFDNFDEIVVSVQLLKRVEEFPFYKALWKRWWKDYIPMQL